jgi:hypothetical protein
MSNSKVLGAGEALDRFFQIVREEAANNPRFERRLLEAVGFHVFYRGEEALVAIDPVLVAMKGREEFRRTFMSMRAADIRKAGKSSDLFRSSERLPTSPGGLTELLWDRASQRLENLTPQRLQAAE